MNIHAPNWTEEAKLKASKLWIDGYSATEIAEHLGLVSRNAVIGIASRNRKLFPKKERTAPRGRRPDSEYRIKPEKPILFKVRKVTTGIEIKARVPKLQPPPVEEWSPYDASSLHKPLLNLQAKECRWPVGHDERGHLFCGHEATGSYCTHHKARSVGRGTISERNAISEARRKA